ISDVSAFRNALQLGTAATRDVGADNPSKLLDLDSFRSMMSGNGALLQIVGGDKLIIPFC
ncbi:hypothetical protein LXO60_23585, partial [Escherichia coli]|uniref:hypothetical protein n=1 Tax=Escherichia coli TaxID=562 RepID=UPI001E5015B1